MRTPTVTLGVILYLTLTTPTFALECPPFPQQVSKDWEVEVNAAVVKIGPVKGGELKTRTQNATKDLLSKVPNAEKIYLEQMMYAAYCTALRDDKTISEANKAKQLKIYAREVRNAISKHQQPHSKGPAPAEEIKFPFVIFDEDNSVVVDAGAMSIIEKITINKKDGKTISDIIVTPKKYLAIAPILESFNPDITFQDPIRGNKFDFIYKRYVQEAGNVWANTYTNTTKPPKSKFRIQVIILPKGN